MISHLAAAAAAAAAAAVAAAAVAAAANYVTVHVFSAEAMSLCPDRVLQTHAGLPIFNILFQVILLLS